MPTPAPSPTAAWPIWASAARSTTQRRRSRRLAPGRLGVLSNADDAFLLPVIRRHGWRFEPVVSSEGAKAYKPDARIFAAYCALVGVGPGEVLYVGDSPYDDVHGAKESGMRAVLVRREQQTPGRTPPPPDVRLRGPDAVITSLTQLPALLPGRLGRRG